MKMPWIASLALLAFAGTAQAQSSINVGTLSCDVSAGVGMILMQKQTLACVFKSADSSLTEAYTGRIDEYGVAIGKVSAGHLVWGVLAPAKGLPKGALAGSYGGVGAEATVGVGLGANVLVGGTGRSFALQPLSVEGQTGVNIAAGVTTVTLIAAP